MRSFKFLFPLCLLAFFACEKTTENQVELLKNPGYHEQWRLMKQNEQGEIPTNLVAGWESYEATKSHKKGPGTGLLNFKELGPNNIGGRVSDLIVDLEDDDRLLAAGNSGGVWESLDNAKTWHPLNDEADILAISSLEQNPINTAIFYYGTGIPAGGIGLPGEGVFKSIDGGKTFEPLDSTKDFGNIWDIKHSLTDSHTFYVATANKGLWKTINGGVSFQQVYATAGSISDIEIMPDGAVLITQTNSGIYRSADGSVNSFARVDKGTPTSGFNRIEISVCLEYPSVVFANFTANVDGQNGHTIGIWKSSNGGKSWSFLSNPSKGTNASFAQPWFTLALSVSPIDTQKVLTGCRDFVYSKDGGLTWQTANNGHADHHAYAFRHSNPDVFYLGCDGGVYAYNFSNLDLRYIDRNIDLNITQFYGGSFTPDSLGNIGGTQDNGTNYSEYGNSKYKHVLGGDGAFCHLHQTQPNTAYMSSQNGHIVRTTNLELLAPSSVSIMNELDSDNDGNIDDGAWFINPFEMNYKNSSELFFPTKQRLFYSYDGAASWIPMSEQHYNLYAVGIPNKEKTERVYFGGANLQVYRLDALFESQPGDEVSLRKNLPENLTTGFISSIVVHPLHDEIIYVSLSNYSQKPRLWRIENADTDEPKWVNISGDLPPLLPANWVAVDPRRPDSFFIAGTDFGLYTSQDAGNTWVKESRMPNVVVDQVRIRHSDRKVFIFTHGRGVFAANLKKVKKPQIIGIPNQKVTRVSGYPNPATDAFNINLEGTFDYIVYSLDGKKIINGTAEKSIDVQKLPVGIYKIAISQEGKKYNTTMVKK